MITLWVQALGAEGKTEWETFEGLWGQKGP